MLSPDLLIAQDRVVETEIGIRKNTFCSDLFLKNAVLVSECLEDLQLMKKEVKYSLWMNVWGKNWS